MAAATEAVTRERTVVVQRTAEGHRLLVDGAGEDLASGRFAEAVARAEIDSPR